MKKYKLQNVRNLHTILLPHDVTKDYLVTARVLLQRIKTWHTRGPQARSVLQHRYFLNSSLSKFANGQFHWFVDSRFKSTSFLKSRKHFHSKRFYLVYLADSCSGPGTVSSFFQVTSKDEGLHLSGSWTISPCVPSKDAPLCDTSFCGKRLGGRACWCGTAVRWSMEA